MFDVLIIGAGPAGLAAALQLARSNRSVLVFDRGKQRTLWAPHYHNFFGFPQGIKGRELLERGREQALSFGAQIVSNAADSVQRLGDDTFEVTSNGQTYVGRRLIFATGVTDNISKVPGILSFMGSTIFHCFDCNGYEMINKSAVVFGSTNVAADAALRALTYTDRVFVATHDEPLNMQGPYLEKLRQNNIEIVQSPIVELRGSNRQLRSILFADGNERMVDCGYSLAGSKPHNELALSLGVTTIKNGHIAADRDMKTNLEYVYAVGDIINSSEQVSLAVAEGIRAAIMLNKTLLGEHQIVRK